MSYTNYNTNDMSICGLSKLDQLKARANGICRQYAMSADSITSLIKKKDELLKKISNDEDFNGMESEVANVLASVFLRNRITNSGFAQAEIESNLRGIKSGTFDIDNAKKTQDELFDADSAKVRKEASSEFLNLAYGSAVEVKEYAQTQTNRNLFDILFVNRGSVRSTSSDLGTVDTPEKLNNNIRYYQQDLLDRIVDYLKLVALPEELSLLKDTKLYIPNTQGTYDYTGVLNYDKLGGLINKYLAPLKFLPENLRDLYKRRLTDMPAKITLDGFNAWVILKHFDTYLDLTLGKSIEIDNFNEKTGKDKYRISSKTSEMISNWRANEDVDAADEIDNITKLLITTTPIYKWQGNLLSDKYLSFQHFSHIIGKIKELSFRPDINRIRIGEFSYGPKQTKTPGYDSLSDGAKEFFTEYDEHGRNIGKKLSTIINYIRRNPREYLPYIFELLTNKEFTDTYGHSIFSSKYWEDEEKDYLYSVAQGIFSGEQSLNFLVDPKDRLDYMNFISLTSDSIFKNSFVLYYVDTDGNLQTRLLIDLSLNRIERQLRMKINTNNGKKFRSTYLDRVDKYKIQDNTKTNPNDSFNSINFTIPNTNIKIIVGTTGTVTLTGYNASAEQLQNIIKFLDDILKLDFINNPRLLETYLRQSTTPNLAYKALIEFASRVMLNQYVQNYILEENLTKSLVMEKVKEIFTENAPQYNTQLGLLNLISNIDRQTIIDTVKADATIKGMMTSAQVKDSELAGLSLISLSRLLGSTMSLWDLVERQPNSATNHFMLLQEGVFEGHFTTNEFYDGNKSKKVTKLSEAELIYSLFISNFIPAFLGKGEKDFLGNGLAAFYASVNSDKGTFGLLKININTEVVTWSFKEDGSILLNELGKPMVVKKALKDLNDFELTRYISDLLGSYFEKVFLTVIGNIHKINSLINTTFPDAQLNLTQDYLQDFSSFNTWFYANAESLKRYGKTPTLLIKYFVAQYNQIHRLNPIEYVDNVHFAEDKKGRIRANNTLLSSLMRFRPSTLKFASNYSELLRRYLTNTDFWALLEKQLLKSLIKSGVIFNLSKNTLLNKHIKDHYRNWVDPKTLYMYIAKVSYTNPKTGNIELKPIIDRTDLIELQNELGIKDSLAVYGLDITINPLILKYNKLDYLITSEWLYSTVGSFLGHPFLKGKDGGTPALTALKLEAAQFLAQHKRNVSFTALMHEFLLNSLKGIPEDYNISVIEDTAEIRALITKLFNDVTPYDGGTFVNPFIVYLENMSLGGAIAGITKKPFVHFKHGRLGTGGIIKTAGFGITNDWMRNSPLLLNFMLMMTDHDWVDMNGESYTFDKNKRYKGGIDILHDWLGNIILYDLTYFRDKNGKFYKIELVPAPDGKGGTLNGYVYRRLTLIDPNTGEELGESFYETMYDRNTLKDRPKPYLINSNYKLWKVFGGVNCYEKTEGGKLVPSEKSITNVVKAMNSIGFKKTKANGEVYNNNEVKTQDQLWQPLKLVDVNYLVTAGAIKQGLANVNPESKYNLRWGFLNIQRIKMYQAGILLDKEHLADHSELSLPTLIVSACSSKGYTYNEAERLYNALKLAAEIGIKSSLETLRDYVKYPEERTVALLTEETLKIVINNVGKSSDSTSFAQITAQAVLEEIKKNPDIKYSSADFPLSDNTIFSQALSSISTYLTRLAIRIKIPGILSVLTPSYNIFKLYGDRKFESFTNPNIDLEKMQLSKDNNPIVDSKRDNPLGMLDGLADLELDRTYKITYARPTENSTYIPASLVIVASSARETALLAAEIGGVDTLRHPDANGMHFGNPFSHTNYQGVQLVVGSVKKAVEAYEQWLRGEAYWNIEPERRLWILDQINSGNLQGKPLVYYTETIPDLSYGIGKYNFDTAPNHAHILLKLINEKRIFRGLKIREAYNLKNNKDGLPAALQVDRVNGIIYINEPLLRQKYTERAWMDIGNGHTARDLSEPVNRDFATFEEFAQFTLMHEYMHTMHKQRGDETNFEYETRMNLEALKEIDRMPEGHMEYEHITDPERLRTLRDQIKNGEVVKIVEYVKEGRNLGAYNVRFNTTTGERFLLWQLDSLAAWYELDLLVKLYPNELERVKAFREWYSLKYGEIAEMSFLDYKKYIRAWLQRDLENLSPSVENKLDLFNRLLSKNPKPKAIDNWLKIVLSKEDYEEVKSLPDLVTAVREKLTNLSKVIIDGVAYDINRDSIKTLAYEIIMPKTFLHEFGFDTYTDLLTVKNDPNYFIKLYLEKLELKAEPRLYDLVLRRNDGNHYYFLDKKHLQGSGLTKVDESTLRTIIEDGKKYVVDKNDRILYELIPGCEIYTNGITQVFVIDDYKDEEDNITSSINIINKYVSDLSYSTLSFSDAIDGTYALDLVKVLKQNSSSTNYISRHIAPEKEITSETVLSHIHSENERVLNKYNWVELLTKDGEFDEKHWLVRMGRAKHTSFLKSLEIVAARIPSQSMQSYMAMQVVAYDNPNLNTAHVSTLLLLLQGSKHI